ncbi:MAG: DinB family protein [Candidatus Heimdallarchaeota archaeon]
MSLSNIGRYHQWVGGQARTLLAELTDEHFTKDLGAPIGSVRDKVVHILEALETMKAFLTNDWEAARANVESFALMKPDTLLEYWQKADHFLATKLQGPLSGSVTIQRGNNSAFVMSLGDFYLQYVLHTVYHRGQLNYCLKVLGKTCYLFL